MSVSLTSSGLVMPAASGTHQSGDANTLDDYEEGTYNPSFTGTGGAAHDRNQRRCLVPLEAS